MKVEAKKPRQISTAPNRFGLSRMVPMSKSLNAVQFDMILLANKNMKHYKRTWYNYPRDAEVGWLNKWFRRKIGLSWLDDCRGVLKKGGWVYRWHTARPAEGGMFHGSEARGQFAWKIVSMLSSRGITVERGVYRVAKKSWKPLKPPTAAPSEVPKDQEVPQNKSGPGDPEDP